MCLRPRRLSVPRATDTNNLKRSSEEGQPRRDFHRTWEVHARARAYVFRACVCELRAAAGVVFGQNRLLLAARFSALSPSPLTPPTPQPPRTLQLAPAFDISGVAPTRTVRPVAGGEKRRRPPPEDFSEVSGGVLHGLSGGLLSLFLPFLSRRQPLP